MHQTVLYIEDNADNIRLVERLIMRRPQTGLRVATSGSDGVKAAAGDRPDLILLDNHLRDATGGEVLQQLAASEATAGIPVIIVSGDSGGGAVDALLQSGACGYLAKPFDIHQFMAIIERYLARPRRDERPQA